MLALIFATVMAMPAAAQVDADLATIATHIDMTSFRNSIGPRRQDGLSTPAEYGFTEIETVDDLVTLSRADGSWLFSFRLLDDKDTLAVCITDRAKNGGSYFTVTAYGLTLDGDLYKAGEPLPDRPDCQP